MKRLTSRFPLIMFICIGLNFISTAANARVQSIPRHETELTPKDIAASWAYKLNSLRIVKTEESGGDEPYIISILFQVNWDDKIVSVKSNTFDTELGNDEKKNAVLSIPKAMGELPIGAIDSDKFNTIGVLSIAMDSDATRWGDMKDIIKNLENALKAQLTAFVNQGFFDTLGIFTDSERTNERDQLLTNLVLKSLGQSPTLAAVNVVDLGLNSFGDVDDFIGMNLNIFLTSGNAEDLVDTVTKDLTLPNNITITALVPGNLSLSYEYNDLASFLIPEVLRSKGEYHVSGQIVRTFRAPGTAPTNLKTKLSGQKVNVSWSDQTSNEDRFELKYKDLATGETVQNILSRNSTSSLVHVNSYGHDYEFKVRAYRTNPLVYSDWSNTSVINVPVIAGPTVTINNVTATSFDLSWSNPNPAVTGYYVSWTDHFRLNRSQSFTGSSGQHTFDNLRPYTVYMANFFAITADDGRDNHGYPIVVETQRLMPLPAAPSNLAINTRTSSGTSLSWQDNSNNESRFEISWGNAAPIVPRSSIGPGAGFNLPTGAPVGGWSTIIGAQNLTSINIPASTSGNITYFKVRACNDGGCSADSNVVAGY